MNYSITKMAKFLKNRKRTKLLVSTDEGEANVADRYPHCLQLYRVSPTEDLSLEDFERFAIERLKGKGA